MFDSSMEAFTEVQVFTLLRYLELKREIFDNPELSDKDKETFQEECVLLKKDLVTLGYNSEFLQDDMRILFYSQETINLYVKEWNND